MHSIWTEIFYGDLHRTISRYVALLSGPVALLCLVLFWIQKSEFNVWYLSLQVALLLFYCPESTSFSCLLASVVQGDYVAVQKKLTFKRPNGTRGNKQQTNINVKTQDTSTTAETYFCVPTGGYWQERINLGVRAMWLLPSLLQWLHQHDLNWDF